MPAVLPSVALCSYIVLSTLPFYYTNNAQPKPYMDEVFHVPQAKLFCEGNFSYWDPMITTLPGLYLSSLVMLMPVKLLSLSEDYCSTKLLRATNLMFMAGNMILLYFIIKKINFKNKNVSNTTVVLNAWTLAFFPVLYFFSNLYYTDPGAVFFTLLMYSLNLEGKQFLSAAVGVVAVVFRQTNIIWVLFVLGLSAARQILNWMEEEKKDTVRLSDMKTFLGFINLVFKNLREKPSRVLDLFVGVLQSTWCYFLVICAFVVFVFVNGSIVVGDKGHHSACLNFPQVFYFLCVTLVFSCMHVASPSKIVFFLRFTVQSPIKVSLFVLIAYYLIAHYTYVHEYLLADNRHYTFYVWSKIYRRHDNVKYGLIVVYLFALTAVAKALHHKDVFWKLVFLVCVCACTIPQKLLEFRYFIIPYFVFRANIVVTSKVKLFVEFLLYASVNVLTFYIYVNKTFKWENSEDLQRFMW